MDKEEAQKENTDLKKILLEYQDELRRLEKQLLGEIDQYRRAMEEEKIKELRKKIFNE